MGQKLGQGQIVGQELGLMLGQAVLTVEAASRSLNLFWVIKVISLSPAYLIALLVIIVAPATVCKPVLLCIKAGLGIDVVDVVRNVCAFVGGVLEVSRCIWILGGLGRSEAKDLTVEVRRVLAWV